MFVSGAVVHITQCIFSGNKATPAQATRLSRAYLGGAIYMETTTAEITTSVFNKNEVWSKQGWHDGGAIFSQRGTLAILDSSFAGNQRSDGAGNHSVSVITGKFALSNVTFGTWPGASMIDKYNCGGQAYGYPVVPIMMHYVC